MNSKRNKNKNNSKKENEFQIINNILNEYKINFEIKYKNNNNKFNIINNIFNLLNQFLTFYQQLSFSLIMKQNYEHLIFKYKNIINNCFNIIFEKIFFNNFIIINTESFEITKKHISKRNKNTLEKQIQNKIKIKKINNSINNSNKKNINILKKHK